MSITGDGDGPRPSRGKPELAIRWVGTGMLMTINFWRRSFGAKKPATARNWPLGMQDQSCFIYPEMRRLISHRMAQAAPRVGAKIDRRPDRNPPPTSIRARRRGPNALRLNLHQPCVANPDALALSCRNER